MLGTLLNAYVSPSFFPYMNLLSLAFPVLIIIHVILCLFWIILKKKRAFIFLLLSLVFIKPVQRWINFKANDNEFADLKIVSYNVKSGLKSSYEEIHSYIKIHDADIILSQEGGALKVPGYDFRTEGFTHTSINSKYKIVKQQDLKIGKKGYSAYADIETPKGIVRIVNVYLHPFSIVKNKVRPDADFEKNKSKTMYLLRRLVPHFKVHEAEIQKILSVVNDSPYPVIVAGDFNAVPNSYEYFSISDKLKDAFVEVGNGSATSFHDFKIPIRIDYFFSSAKIIPVRYKIDRTVELSDHYPVIAEFKIQK